MRLTLLTLSTAVSSLAPEPSKQANSGRRFALVQHLGTQQHAAHFVPLCAHTMNPTPSRENLF